MTIPITLLTGFLGAGKTTLVARLLRDARFSDTAVIINEFGEVGIDHLLVERVPEQAVVEMTSGCLCCTVRGDIRRALLMLQHRSENGELPLFARVVIETTGLADPAPVIQTLMTDPQLARRFHLASVVTIVDAANGAATLVLQPEAVKQIAVADRLIVTKTDTAAGAAGLPDLLTVLRLINAAAPIDYAASPAFDLRRIADGSGFNPAAKGPEVLAWLDAEAHAQVHAGHHHGVDHHDASHDVTRHGDEIRSFCLTIDAPMSALGFGFAMDLLAGNVGSDILRVKGLVAIADYPDRPVVVHMVQHIVSTPARLDVWPSDDRRTRLVFITRNLDPAIFANFFDRWARASPSALAAMEHA